MDDRSAVARRSVRVALVDSGVAADHPLLRDRVVLAIACDPLGRDPPRPLAPGAGRDRNTHGTGLASILIGLAPTVEIVDVALLDHRVTCTQDALISALRHLAERDLGIEIVNLSLEVQAPSAALVEAVRRLHDLGMTVIQARRRPEPLAEGAIPVVAGAWSDPYRVEPSGLGLAARGKRTRCAAPCGGQTYQEGASLAAATLSGLAAALFSSRSAARRAWNASRLLENYMDRSSRTACLS